MPDAAKLVAAVLMAATGFFGATSVIPHMPENQRVGQLWVIAVILGAATGWRLLGPDMAPVATRPRSAMGPVGAGIKAAVVTALCTLFVASFVVMISRSLDRRYNGPMEAVVGIFDIALDYARLFTHPDVILTLAIGGILAAYAARGAGRAWG